MFSSDIFILSKALRRKGDIMKKIILLIGLTLLTSVVSYGNEQVLDIKGEITNESSKVLNTYLIIYREAARDTRLCQNVRYPDAQRTVYQKRKTQFIKVNQDLNFSQQVQLSPKGLCWYEVTHISFVVATPEQAERFRKSKLTGSFGSLSYDLLLPEEDDSDALPAGSLTTVQCHVDKERNAHKCNGDDQALLVSSDLKLNLEVLITTD